MFIRANGIDIHLQQSGPDDGEVLLLLHSLGTQGAIWEAPAEAFSGRYRVLRPDLRGHGLTTVTPGPYSIEGLAQDMLALLDVLKVTHAHVAGVSIGGMVAQALAALAPERVRSLTLIDTALVIPPAQLWRDRAVLARTEGMAPLVEPVLARWVTEASLQSAEAAGLRAMLRRTDPQGYAGAAEAIAAADLTEASRRLRVPTLVLVGDSDVATPLSAAQALCAAIDGAALAVIADAAHIPTMEQPARVTSAMQRFLANVPTSQDR